ncbi:hypothetical protein Tco_0551032 [Tanacetum coccineum]
MRRSWEVLCDHYYKYNKVKLASLNVKQSPQVVKVAQRCHVHMNLKRCAEDINDEGIADMASYENGSSYQYVFSVSSPSLSSLANVGKGTT